MTTARLPRLIAAAGLVAWIASAAIVWLGGSPLGHDEAQYVLDARDWLAGAEPRWFYLSSGMRYVTAVGLQLGGGEVALRFPTFVLGIAFVLTAAALAWRIYGPMTAAWVIGVLAGLRCVMQLSAELLSDLPATAFLLAGTLVLADEILRRDDGPRWRVIGAAPLFAAALYLRYASCVPIAIVGVAVAALGWRRIARAPAPVAATVAAFALMLVPHFLSAMRDTGSPLGILLASKGVPGQTWIAEGLATYLTSNPFRYYGVLAPPILLAGLAAPALMRDRPTLLLWSAGVGDIVALGLISHAQPRYIFFGIALLAILGVEVLRRAIAERRIAAIVAGVAVALATVLVMRQQLHRADYRAETTTDTRRAAEVIRADAAGARCYVIGDQYTQLEHYSGCEASAWPWDDQGTAKIYMVQKDQAAPRSWRGRRHVLVDEPQLRVTRWDP